MITFTNIILIILAMVLEDMIQGKLNIVTVTVTVGSSTVTSHCHTDLRLAS